MSSQIVNQNWRNATQSNQPYSPIKSWSNIGDNRRILTIELPGFTKDRLRINLNTRTRTLIITGQKSDGLFNITPLNEHIQIEETCSLDEVHAKLVNDTLQIIFFKT